MTPVPVLDGLAGVFGEAGHLPAWDTIPEDFRCARGDAKVWCDLVETWFYEGLRGQFVPKSGVDEKAALNAVKAVMGSFEPKHQHKMAGCAYLLSEWFDRFEKSP